MHILTQKCNFYIKKTQKSILKMQFLLFFKIENKVVEN